MVPITFTWANSEEWTWDMQDFADKVSDLRPTWPRVGRVLENIVAAAFVSRGADTLHGAWEDVTERTKERKLRPSGSAGAIVTRAYLEGFQILVESGRMRDSFREGGVDHHEEMTETSYVWGSNVEYSLYHQWGFRTRLGGGYGAFGSEFTLSAIQAKRGWAGKRGEEKRREGLLAEVPARRMIDPTEDQRFDILDALQRGIVNQVRSLGARYAKTIYGPGELSGMGGGEFFQMGKAGGSPI